MILNTFYCKCNMVCKREQYHTVNLPEYLFRLVEHGIRYF